MTKPTFVPDQREFEAGCCLWKGPRPLDDRPQVHYAELLAIVDRSPYSTVVVSEEFARAWLSEHVGHQVVAPVDVGPHRPVELMQVGEIRWVVRS
ncbi:MAG: hypothetical protein AB7S38_28915 [Vulcanimicrobiota bacterium]